jgi:hypothetical protein
MYQSELSCSRIKQIDLPAVEVPDPRSLNKNRFMVVSVKSRAEGVVWALLCI